MKRIFTCMLFFAGMISVKAQKYIPFPTTKAIWTERQGVGDTAANYYCYGMKGEDTIIKSKSYHKLYKSVDSVFDASEYVGALREDKKKILFYESGATADRILYNFAMVEGDTMNYYTGPQGIVSFIDSVEIAGVFHKRFNFKTLSDLPWTAGAWVEGIGNISLGGLLRSAMAQPTCDCASNLVCFKQAGDWEYHNPLYLSHSCFHDPLAIEDVQTNKTTVTLSPNPVTGISHLHINGTGSYKTFTVYNVTGTTAMSYNIINNQDISINKNDYPSGIYYYRLGDDAGAYTIGKFMVQ